MQRSRLKNIINKSKEISIRDPFDSFAKTLPTGIVPAGYRLQRAWETWGKPKNYEAAIGAGLIEDGEFASIGYDESNDTYEYLNEGRANETVNRDISVWENDVVPYVTELKKGGFLRLYDDEAKCWKYQKGGVPKKPFAEWVKDVNPDLISDDYDLEKAYNELPTDELDAWKKSNGKTHLNGDYKKPNHMTYSDEGYGWTGSENEGWTFRVSPRQTYEHSFDEYVDYWKKNEPTSKLDYNGRIYTNPPVEFKEGGQLNLIPDGSLHARNNNMPNAGEDYTKKGVPVVDMNGSQQAEIEREEIILNLSTTEKVERYYKQFNEEESESKKDEIAIKCGKMLAKSIIEDTNDRAGVIEKVTNEI